MLNKIINLILWKINLFLNKIFHVAKNFFLFNQKQNLSLRLSYQNKGIRCTKLNTIFDNSLPKIFVIGHNKTGTVSLHKLFINNGYKSYHYENELLGRIIKQNFLSNAPLLEGIEDAHLYSDMECGWGLSYEYNLFPQLDLQYPGSFFIYNYRDIEEWILSRTAHEKGLYINRCIKNLNTFYGYNFKKYDDIHNHWRSHFKRHETMIKKYFEAKKNLIILNLNEKKSKLDLCVKLKDIGFKINESELPHRHKSSIHYS